MNLDWRRLKAVVLESDDWGLCAWSPDEQAYRVLADTPAFRGATGRVYGRSTLESAQDVKALADLLLVFRGGDGFPPVWQANVVMAAPNYEALRPPMFEVDALPLIGLPQTPSRWQRPGMWEAVRDARQAGVWWPELHGLHHLPERAWLTALRRGESDARRAHEQQSPVCQAVEASGEYDSSEPDNVRLRNLEHAVEAFTQAFRRAPQSFCPPDYRWDGRAEREAERLGLTTFQGKAEQDGFPLPGLRRLAHRFLWPNLRGRRFYMPPRIAFEPRGSSDGKGRHGVQAAHRRIRETWGRGQPAIVSTHRVNYAHLDPPWAEAGRSALRDLLERLAVDGAVFLTDAEVRQLVEWNWSVRSIGQRGALLRYYGVPRDKLRFPAPEGVKSATIREGRGPDGAEAWIEEADAVARVNVGEYVIEWGWD